MISALSARYARALVDVVFTPGNNLDPVDASSQLRTVQELISGSPELHIALSTPAVSTARKRAVIEKIAGRLGVAPLIRNFLFVLINHRRIPQLTEIREAFDELTDERMGFVLADIASALPLSERQNTEVGEVLSRLSGKQVKLRASVDPDLLGGVVARMGSTVYDGSIRGRLRQLKRTLIEETAQTGPQAG
ncbi:MAG TPA: ATP synthase F1 subunit delta [Bryobacteraceae bacterium]|nr:ATP synthase F1 subunit delta [Bryobacteraceae bacterium]